MPKKSLIERLRAKKQTNQPVVGVTWYTEENWAKVKASAIDPERFEASFSEWITMANQALADIRNKGIKAVPFNVVAEDLQTWCLAHNKPNSAASRAEFVSKQLRNAGTAST